MPFVALRIWPKSKTALQTQAEFTRKLSFAQPETLGFLSEMTLP